MNFKTFKSKYKKWPVLFSRDIVHASSHPQTMVNQLCRWVKEDLLIQLRRGIYILNEDDRHVHPSRLFIANQQYIPSYVSLEFALGFYDLIPEKVVQVTSVTSQKTTHFENAIGYFKYSHIKKSAYDGFHAMQDESGLTYFIATPEKAIIDFLYFKSRHITTYESSIFEKSFRFQNMDTVDVKKLQYYATLYRSKKLLRLVDLLCQSLKKGNL